MFEFTLLSGSGMSAGSGQLVFSGFRTGKLLDMAGSSFKFGGPLKAGLMIPADRRISASVLAISICSVSRTLGSVPTRVRCLADCGRCNFDLVGSMSCCLAFFFFGSDSLGGIMKIV